MARKRHLFIMPQLRDAGGDLSKKWYIEYSCMNPYKDKMERHRIYVPNSLTTKAERTAFAESEIAKLKSKLENGWMPYDKETVTYQDELIYANVAKRIGCDRKNAVNIRSYLSDFLSIKKAQVNPKSYQTYVSKCRIFCEWCEMNEYDRKPISAITQDAIIQYLSHLAEHKHLSRLSIDKYSQILHSFFDYLKNTKRVIIENPVQALPRLGTVKDEAARPIPDRTRKQLINEIRKNDRQLYLICMLEYYCAIRPNECRLLKISDIDFESRSIRVRNEISKNSKTEIVSIPAQLYNYLKEIRLDVWPCTDDYIFSRNGMPGKTPLGKNNFRNRFNRYRRILGLSEKYKLYSFKHTGGVKLVEAGVDTWKLQQHFRHKSISTTEAYIRNRIVQRDDIIDNNFPDI